MTHTDAMVNHMTSKIFSVHKYQLTFDCSSEADCIFCKGRCCDEYPFSCPLTLQGAGKFLDFRPPHDSLPAFGLKINHVKAQSILLDDPVDTAITASPNCSTGILP